MAGCYGNDPEDRYFENKLFEYLEQTEDDLMRECQSCQKEFNAETSDAREPDSYCNRECENEHLLDVLDRWDILDGNHLQQILLDGDKLRKQCDESLNDIDEIEGYLKHIRDQIRQK